MKLINLLNQSDKKRKMNGGRIVENDDDCLDKRNQNF